MEQTKETSHLLPPGPRGEAMEDVLDIALKEMEDASEKDRKELEEKRKREQDKALQQKLSPEQGLVNKLLPEILKGKPEVLPQAQPAHEDIGGFMAHASLSVRLIAFLGLVIAGEQLVCLRSRRFCNRCTFCAVNLLAQY